MIGLWNSLSFWSAVSTVLISMFCFSLGVIILSHIFKNKITANSRLKNIFSVHDTTKKSNKKSKIKYSGSNELITRTRLFDVIKNELVLAGVMMKPDEFIIIWIILTFVPSGIFAFTGAAIPAIALVFAGLLAPPWYIRRSKGKHIAKFESQLSDALDIMSNCLQSGLTFHQALESISNEMGDPIAREFKRVLREVQYGSTLDNALNGMTERIKSNDLMLMVSAVLIQRQVGGNLSQLLSNISVTIKERVKLKEEIKVLTSTGRMSGMVIGLMPVVMLGILMLINPGYIKAFFNTQLGMFMLATAAVMELIGFVVVRKIVSIKF